MRRQPLVWVIVGVLLLGALVAGLLMVFRPLRPLSEAIFKQLTFSMLYPEASTGYVVDASSASYDSASGVLLFHARSGSQDLTITEQATPDQFNDVPEYYGKFVEKLRSYSTFESLHGRVALTRPVELKGQQSAVFNGKGTLMFIHPSHDLSEGEWRKLFNSLVIAQ